MEERESFNEVLPSASLHEPDHLLRGWLNFRDRSPINFNRIFCRRKAWTGSKTEACLRSSVGSCCSPGELSLLQDVNDTILTGSRPSHDITEEDGKRHVTQQLLVILLQHETFSTGSKVQSTVPSELSICSEIITFKDHKLNVSGRTISSTLRMLHSVNTETEKSRRNITIVACNAVYRQRLGKHVPREPIRMQQ